MSTRTASTNLRIDGNHTSQIACFP
uniref:Uncharacterized protein n=1 Tax=Anguilla anguilla TaxID=7936 RepID=A0A0E9QGK5_ANGAN